MKKKLLRNVCSVAVITALYWIIEKYCIVSPSASSISPYLSLGFLMTAAYIFGMSVRHVLLPSITGYLVAGILFGPPLINIIPSADLQALELINALALSFIAITAGGELRFSDLARNSKTLISLSLAHVFIIVPFMAIVCMAYFYFAGFPNDMQTMVYYSLMAGILALANSPASTIAVIQEYGARGRCANTVLSVTLVKDVLVILLFSILVSYAGTSVSSDESVLMIISESLAHIALSCFVGICMGIGMIVYFKFVGRDISIFILVASYLVYEFSDFAGLEQLFMGLSAGCIVQNCSRQGTRMIEAIEKSHLPVYVVFFAISGAGLSLSNISSNIVFISIFVVARIAVVYISTKAGCAVARAPAPTSQYAWTGFIANAGLAISMLIVIDEMFPSWGNLFKTIFLAIIAVNQIVGPVVFTYGLHKSGEARQA